MPDWNDWWESPLGQYVIEHEQAYFDQVVTNLFGFHAVQVGMSQLDLLRANRMPHRIKIGRVGMVDLHCDPANLPLESGSIDLIVLPHVLDFNANPHQVLREAERVLVADGQLLIAGFNPWSLWGGKRLWLKRQGMPWRGHFLSLPRIKDWLKLLSFDISDNQLTCYVPPFVQPQWRQRFGFMERLGARWWPVAGGVYFLHAVKRVQGMRLITPAWQQHKLRARLAALAERQGANVSTHQKGSTGPHHE
ncbi:SAM-dependent methyltransferase [Chitinivorax tropicus]|uniref:SAM-dependent methyltransferase n=1 Tax=Chitinivorax tropicus TaxID=714531 RepID=A0A840MTE2_9PROT|nr:methyltransferase domain-containing protein [Chitinivorax tropicus]MBB5019656.1 SAM-dependent methyltransferase [Chitinivorax tropicus]